MTDPIDLARVATSRLQQYAQRTKALRILIQNADITHDEFFRAKYELRQLIENASRGQR